MENYYKSNKIFMEVIYFLSKIRYLIRAICNITLDNKNLLRINITKLIDLPLHINNIKVIWDNRNNPNNKTKKMIIMKVILNNNPKRQ